MPTIFAKTTNPSDFKTLPADVILIGAFYERSGWEIDCFVRGAASLDEALSFAVQTHTHLNDHPVFATAIGGAKSLRKYARATLQTAPPPVVVLEDITDVTVVP